MRVSVTEIEVKMPDCSCSVVVRLNGSMGRIVKRSQCGAHTNIGQLQNKYEPDEVGLSNYAKLDAYVGEMWKSSEAIRRETIERFARDRSQEVDWMKSKVKRITGKEPMLIHSEEGIPILCCKEE